MYQTFGVSNWDFDFRGRKFQGDWQAAWRYRARAAPILEFQWRDDANAIIQLRFYISPLVPRLPLC